jgi:basic amino acid/polyamine antiporter, APA family
MIGTGIFVAPGFVAGDLADVQLFLLIWVVGAVAALSGALCFSELAVNFPSSGGEYVYLTRAYGPTWGFITGWVSFFAGFSAPIAISALAFSEYLSAVLPAIQSRWAVGAWELTGAQLLATALVILFTVINILGIGRMAKVQNVLTTLKIGVLLAFLGMGFLIGQGDWAHFGMDATRTSTTPLPQQFAMSLFWIYVSYSGWNAATYVAEEIRNPARTLPVALAFGTGLVAALFVALNVLFLYAAPLSEMQGELKIGALAANKLFGPGVAGIFSVLMALSIMSSVSAMVTIGPRVYYAMAKNGAFFSVAARVHERYRTPVPAIIAQALCAIAMTLTPLKDLFSYVGMTLNFTALLAVASIFIFRRRPDWQKLRAVSFAYPLVPGIFVLMGTWMTIYAIMQQNRASFAAILTIVLGALVYRFRLRSQARA